MLNLYKKIVENQVKLHFLGNDILDIRELKNKKIALITNNSNIDKVYLTLKDLTEDLDVFSTTNVIEKKIREKELVDSDRNKWLVKVFIQPLSETEKDAINLSKKISESYFNIISDIVSSSFSEVEANVFSQILAENLEDQIFNECSSYIAYKEIEKNYDYIIYNYNYMTKSSIIQLLNSSSIREKSYIIMLNKEENRINLENDLKAKVVVQIPCLRKYDLQQIRIKFKKIWNSLKYDDTIDELDRRKTLTLCANMHNKNYAYYPSAQEILHLAKDYNIDISLLPASYMNYKVYNEYKNIVLEDTGFRIKTEVFRSDIREILSENNELGNKVNNEIGKYIQLYMESTLLEELPNELYMYLVSKINKSVNEFGLNLAMYYRMKQYLKSTNLLVTTMDRSMNSRLATFVAKQNGIYTIGIQPQVISTSERYRIPMVDKMLVIDTLQEENFITLGYPKNKMLKVGSANLRKHINLIETAEEIHNKDSSRYNILFIMQHSMPEDMAKCIDSLKQISSKFQIYLKPHPHQEELVLETTSRSIKDNNNILLLDKDDVTYQYIKHCNLIIGLFSSAIYEAILANKDVIILQVTELHPSVDFSKFSTCLKVYSTNELNIAINSFLEDKVMAERIRNIREKYILDNSYIYTKEALESCILKKLDKEFLNK